MNDFEKKYFDAFTLTFGELSEEEIRSLSDWDSAASMTLVSAVEDSFDIMMDIEDILLFTSYEAGLEIVRKYVK